MEEQNMTVNAKMNLSLSKLLAAATLTAGLLLSAPRAVAEDGCFRRTVYAEHRLHEAIEHHGYYSWEAVRWRHKLHEARERCWRERQLWWSEHEHRWHHDRDWDDHDHDRD
jgi:hypothetical protein